jgi:nucleoid DNA-binding protein
MIPALKYPPPVRTRKPSSVVTKSEMVDQVRKQVGLTEDQAKIFIAVLVEKIKSTLEEGHEVKIPGFGKWGVRSKAARVARNPKTKEEVTIPPRKVVYFTPAEKLKLSLNDPSVEV